MWRCMVPSCDRLQPFSRERNFRKHLRKHMSTRKYGTCPHEDKECEGLAFAERGNLTRHHQEKHYDCHKQHNGVCPPRMRAVQGLTSGDEGQPIPEVAMDQVGGNLNTIVPAGAVVNPSPSAPNEASTSSIHDHVFPTNMAAIPIFQAIAPGIVLLLISTTVAC